MPTYPDRMGVTSEVDAGTVLRRLAEGLPPQALVTDPDLMESYRYDRARFCPAGTPVAVVLALAAKAASTSLVTLIRPG